MGVRLSLGYPNFVRYVKPFTYSSGQYFPMFAKSSQTDYCYCFWQLKGWLLRWEVREVSTHLAMKKVGSGNLFSRLRAVLLWHQWHFCFIGPISSWQFWLFNEHSQKDVKGRTHCRFSWCHYCLMSLGAWVNSSVSMWNRLGSLRQRACYLIAPGQRVCCGFRTWAVKLLPASIIKRWQRSLPCSSQTVERQHWKPHLLKNTPVMWIKN